MKTETEWISYVEPVRGYRSELVQLMKAAKNESSPNTIGQFAAELLRMLHKLTDAQAKHEEVNKKMMAQCFEEDAFRKKEIDDARNSLNAASGHLSKCQASLHAAQENLPNLTKALKDYEDELKKKTEERAHQHALYLQRKKDWNDAIAFLEDFIKVVNEKLGKYPTSLAELSEKLLKHTSKLGLVHEAVPVLIAMTTFQAPGEGAADIPHATNNYSYQAQGKTVGSLKDKLNGLKNKLVQDARQNDLDEEKAQKLFEALKANLESIIAKLKTDIARTEEQIKAMKSCIADEEAIVHSAGDKLARNDKLKNAAAHTCDDFAKEFIKATKNRLEEIETVNTIIEICRKRFSTLPEDLVKYLEEVKTNFRTYVNGTAFKKYEDYVQKHQADNVHGNELAHRVEKPKAPKAAARKKFF